MLANPPAIRQSPEKMGRVHSMCSRGNQRVMEALANRSASGKRGQARKVLEDSLTDIPDRSVQ
jgi:hypothetical protein